MNKIITNNIFIQIVGKIAGLIVVFATTALIARGLGPEQYGFYSIIFVFLSFISVLVDFGLQIIAVRESSYDEKNIAEIAGNLYWIKVIGGGFVYVISSILFAFSNFNHATKTGFLIAAVSFFFIALTSVPNTIFQSKLKIRYSVFSEIIGQSVFLCLVAIIFFFKSFQFEPFYFYLAANVVSSILTFLFGLLFASRIIKIKWQFDSVISKRLLRDTLPLAIVMIISQINFRGDSLLLSLIKSERDVGIYSVAFKFFEISMVFPGIIMTVVFPLLSRYRIQDTNINIIAEKSFNILVISGLLIMILIYFMAPQLVSWIGGKDYTEAIFPLKILGFAILFGFINSIFVYIVIAKNRQQKILFISISGAVLSIILNLLFIPLYSYKACAVIAVFIGFYGMAFMGYLAYRASGFNPFLSISLKKTT